MNDLTTRQAMAGIAVISMVTLMFELLINKVFSFSSWGSLGYMIIGSAIFGFSIAGVVIALWRPERKYRVSTLLGYASLTLSLSVVLCYMVMNIVPFDVTSILRHPVKQVLYFTIWYLSLLTPFSMAGFIIALLLLVFKDTSNRLYAADLVGAGIGCVVLVPFFPLIGASGLYFVCGALGAVGTILFSCRGNRKAMTMAGLLLALFLALSPFADRIYPVKTHCSKRTRQEHFEAGYIKQSMWSFLSKIEVAILPDENSGIIWFDGGMMESGIDRFDGDYEYGKKGILGANSIVYRLEPRRNVLIIAPAGGREVRAALTWGAQKITGVELDTSVVNLVRDELNGYLGGIFRDPRVTLINDEGRSFVRRSREKYDAIQMISAYSVTAVQSGAVDLASSYLITKEAFHDYIDHLTEDGVLSVSRDMSLKLFFTGWEVLEDKGLDPADKIVLILNDGSTLGRNTLLLKTRPFEKDELDRIKEICLAKRMPINYAPPGLLTHADRIPELASEIKTRRLIEEFVAVPRQERRKFYDSFPYRVRPVVDDNPFFNNVRYFFRDMRSIPDRLTDELEEYTKKTYYIPFLPIGYLAKLIVLAEAAVFALLFLIFPLWKFRSEGVRLRWQRWSMCYFLCLGLGFIWIELVLLKKFILFLGNPVYSITVVLFAMLVFAGLGSLFSERLGGNLNRSLGLVGAVLVLMVLLIALVYPKIFHGFLGFSFPLRILVAVLLIAPVGFVLGIPFPIGLKFLGNSSPDSIPWAWAMNGYTTVIGVSTSSLVAMQTGFAVLLFISLGVYLLGFACLRASQAMLHSQP